MNIEELFDNELYHNYGMLTTEEANILINYLKEEVMEYVAGLQKRIAELECAIKSYEQVVDEIHTACDAAGCMIGIKYSEFISSQAARINELEADRCIGPDCNKPRLWRGLGFENTTVTTGGFTARVAELEAALDVRDRKLSDISNACKSAGCLDDEAMDEFIFKQKQRIAELEAQVPNVVTPVNGKCPNCGGYCGWRYCCHCGAKLDWT